MVNEFGQWIRDHDAALNVWTLWAFAILASALAILELVTWLVMLGTRDRSALGPPLRRKKIGYIFAFSSVAALAALSLYAMHHDIQEELALRSGFRLYGIAGMATGFLFGVWFVTVLLREKRSRRRARRS